MVNIRSYQLILDASRVLIYTRITEIHQVSYVKTKLKDPKPAARGTNDCMTVTVCCQVIVRDFMPERLVRWKASGADSLGAHQKVVVTCNKFSETHMTYAFHCISSFLRDFRHVQIH